MLESVRYFLNTKRLLLLGVGVAVAVILVVVLAVSLRSGPTEEDNGAVLARLINNDTIAENVKFFSRNPHPAGSEENLELAMEIKRRWIDYGFDDVFDNNYEVLLSFPTNDSYIKYSGGIKYKPTVESGKPDPPFNAFSKNGLVTGKAVYVNYGTVEDFAQLDSLGVDLSGKIALCRYGKIFRGSKADNAYDKGMVGMILYTDPLDSGSGAGPTFPDGPWLPDSGVQRGNVKTIKGDLSTHLYPSIEGGYHASQSELEELSPKIPVIPIPYSEVVPLHDLIKIADPSFEIPENWGDYKIGPSVEDIELKVENKETFTVCQNVIGVINGKEEPDRWVIVGFHRDAWINGAADPVSGLSTVMEITRALSTQLKEGWRPRRSLIFASWDAEEPGIMGSYEFTEDYMTALKHQAVAYINMDTVVSQPQLLNMKSTPNLFDLIYKCARETESPNSDYETMYDFWVGAEEQYNNIDYSGSNPPISLIGSGSDYTAFLNEVGVSCLDFAYKTSYGSYPVYHTQYDTFEWISTYGDPDFTYHKRIGQFAMRVIHSLADDSILQMSPSRYASKVQSLITELIQDHEESIQNRNLSMSDLKKWSQNFLYAAQKVENEILDLAKNPEALSLHLRNLNDKLMLIDRQFIYEVGLPGRPSFRHLIFAPSSSNTYAGSAFPGISDGILNQDDESTKMQISLVSTKLEAAMRSLLADGFE